jgi:hypothetical protein
MNIKTLGLKSSYVFKETHITTSCERSDIHRVLKRSVAPAIRDLESEKLTNGFHYIVHENIDLRLSSDDWPQHESRIREVLAGHSIPTDIKDWELEPSECYGGETGVLLCYNNLESNSRLCLALVELIYETDNKTIRQKQEGLCPNQWVHYLCNQAGYLNFDQIRFELNDAFKWLESLVSRHGNDPQVHAKANEILMELRDAITRFEISLMGNGP